MKKRIILLNGPPGSGKDEIATYLSSTKSSHKYHHLKFANCLVWMCSYMFDSFSDFDYSYETFKKSKIGLNGETGRDLMISLSETTIKPILGKDVWTKFMIRRIEDTDDTGFMNLMDGYVISDTGFPNEVTDIKERFPEKDVQLWRIITSEDQNPFGKDSRRYLDNPNKIIVNEKTGLEDLYAKVDILL